LREVAVRWWAGAAIALMAQPSLAASSRVADDEAARLEALRPHFRDYRPPGSGPFPALLLVSGCSGFSRRGDAYTGLAEQWRDKGYAVVFVDFLAARGRDRCFGDVAVADIGNDVLAVARDLQRQPSVKRSGIVAVGWSLGGGGVLAALGRLAHGEDSPLQAVIAYYPVCGSIAPWDAGIPALALMGAADKVARPAVCQELFARLPAGVTVETRVYPEAEHGFNFAGRNYNAAAAAAAAADFDHFISRLSP
jgi:dienelactone hydrolase